MDAGFISSSGTLIGAVLETVGYYYQELVLDTLAAPLTTSVGALIYIVGGIIAMVTFVVQGHFKLGLWFLLGPSLYFSMIVPRTDTFGSAWMFGEQVRNNEIMRNEAEAMLQEDEFGRNSTAPAQVSAVFAWYTDLVAVTIREMVRVLNLGRPDVDFSFIKRMEIFGALHNASIDDPRFKDLIHHAFLTDCRELTELGKKLADPQTIDDVAELEVEYSRRKGAKVSLSRPAIEYVAGLRAAYPELYAMIVDNDPTNEDQFLSNLAGETGAPATDTFDQDYSEGVQQIGTQAFTCDQVWSFTRAGLILFARTLVNQHVRSAGANNIQAEKLLRDLGKLTGVNDQNSAISEVQQLNSMYRSIATYVLRNEVNRGSTAAFISDYVNKIEIRELEAPGYEGVVEFERIRAESIEWEEQTRMMTAASQLPYYQGLILYFLATLFPFFALMVLIPGRHSGFLFWFSLWFWAKSWDVGFAIVMLLDDVLFGLFAVAHRSDAIKAEPELDPELFSAFQALAELDPTFQMSTYYAIMGTAIMSIPIVTAHLFLGAVKAGAGMVAQGVSEYSTHFASGGYNLVSQNVATAQGAAAMNEKFQRAAGYGQNVVAGRGEGAGFSGGPHDKAFSGGGGNNELSTLARNQSFQNYLGAGRNWTSADDLLYRSTGGAQTMMWGRGVTEGLAGRPDAARASHMPGGGRGKFGKAGAVFEDVTAGIGGVAGSVADQTLKIRDGRMVLSAKSGAMDAINTEEMQKRSQITQATGSLALLMAPDRGRDQQALDYDAAVFLAYIGIGSNAVSTTTKTIFGLGDKGEESDKRSAERRRKGSGSGWQDLARGGAGAIGVVVGTELLENGFGEWAGGYMDGAAEKVGETMGDVSSLAVKQIGAADDASDEEGSWISDTWGWVEEKASEAKDGFAEWAGEKISPE